MSDDMGQTAREKLKSAIQRVERLEEEKKALMADIKEVYDEAKAFGLDTKILRQVIRIRKMDVHERTEQEAILALYLDAIGEI